MARKTEHHTELSRRERQIMDIVYRLGEATAAEVRENLSDPPGYSAVRAMLRILEEKGHLKHDQLGPRYVFQATLPVESARRTALRRLLQTFFDNSLEEAVATLLDVESSNVTEEELERLARMIDQARKEGR
ncbi:MAG TPA: BlaI/MecI/CopY family transcriptional regulator [Gemmatimonadota bacterium]|nr:BlaI/MecI/CopY family transcriptional regulator [Gemmatimonadota bacterium]